MKKIIVIIAVLSLLVGTAYAADLNSGLTRQVYAQSRGRSVVSDGSVLMKVWYTGFGTNPAIGVSTATTLLLYSDIAAGTIERTFTTGTAPYTTVGGVVASINSVTGWHAVVGPDGYPAFSTNGTLLTSNFESVGRDEGAPGSVYLDCSDSCLFLCGVEAVDGVIPRIKQVTHKVAGTGNVRVRIYDDDTVVWRQNISPANYNTGTAKDASPNTIIFTTQGEKGLAGRMGKGLCVEVNRSLTLGDTGDKTNETNISILYDQF